MDKDWSTAYAVLAGILGALFGVAPGVFFCVVAGALLSVRFCETKTTKGIFTHLAFSVVIVCIIIGEVQSNLPTWTSAKLAGLAGGFLFMLLAEMIYISIKSFNLGKKLDEAWDKVVDKWTR